MRRMTILFFCLLFVNLIFAQEHALRISNTTSTKEVIIKENKRIRIRTLTGEKISGRFRIVDNNTLWVANQPVELTNITEIKRNPLLLSIFTSSFFIYAGALTVGMGAIVGVFGDSSAFLLAIPGAGLIYTGIKSPNFNRKYKRDKGWTYELFVPSQ